MITIQLYYLYGKQIWTYSTLHENSLVLNRYISGYLTKAEKRATDTLWDECNKRPSLAGILKSFALQSLKTRELGAYEVVDKLMGHCLFQKSVSIKWLGK